MHNYIPIETGNHTRTANVIVNGNMASDLTRTRAIGIVVIEVCLIGSFDGTIHHVDDYIKVISLAHVKDNKNCTVENTPATGDPNNREPNIDH